MLIHITFFFKLKPHIILHFYLFVILYYLFMFRTYIYNYISWEKLKYDVKINIKEKLREKN